MSFSYDCVVHCVIDELGPSFEVFVGRPDPGIQHVDVDSAPITCHVVGKERLIDKITPFNIDNRKGDITLK